jgi:phosphatidylserine/phosphatidylglycerophosphate/cardiolipin synthase-like enzyme
VVDALEVRNLDTFEHGPYLTEALTTARRRLLITSPWVRNAVVNKELMDQVWALARRDVTVHVGYRISPDADGCDAGALGRLAKLHERFGNVVVGRLGDTHAKVLIWDDSQIVTGFNWLSFRGDQDRTYRQEVGVLLKNNRSDVDAFYAEQRAAIEKVAGKSARDQGPDPQCLVAMPVDTIGCDTSKCLTQPPLGRSPVWRLD